MKIDPNLLVTVSNRRNQGLYQVFVTNLRERFVFGLRECAKRKRALAYAEDLAMQWSCGIEFK